MDLLGTVTLCDPKGQLGALSSWRAGKAQFQEWGCCVFKKLRLWVGSHGAFWAGVTASGDWPPPNLVQARCSDDFLSPSSVQKEVL